VALGLRCCHAGHGTDGCWRFESEGRHARLHREGVLSKTHNPCGAFADFAPAAHTKRAHLEAPHVTFTRRVLPFGARRVFDDGLAPGDPWSAGIVEFGSGEREWHGTRGIGRAEGVGRSAHTLGLVWCAAAHSPQATAVSASEAVTRRGSLGWQRRCDGSTATASRAANVPHVRWRNRPAHLGMLMCGVVCFGWMRRHSVTEGKAPTRRQKQSNAESSARNFARFLGDCSTSYQIPCSRVMYVPASGLRSGVHFRVFRSDCKRSDCFMASGLMWPWLIHVPTQKGGARWST